MGLDVDQRRVPLERSGRNLHSKQSAGLTTDIQATDSGQSQFRSLTVAPTSGGQALFLSGFDGLFRSDNNATQWREIQTLVNYVVGVAVSPDYADDGTVVATSYVKGAYLSTDRGATWRGAHVGLGSSPGTKFAPKMPRLHNVQFSPNYENDGTIFTATWWDVLKSTDRGVSWTTIPVGTSPPDLRQFVIAVSPQYATDGTVYVGTRQGEIYRSTAQGAANTWTLMANVGSQIRSLVLNPAFSTEPVLYASTFVRIYKSVDAGSSWQPTGPPGISMLAISPNYQTDGSLFAGTPSGVFVTRDKGASWTELTAPPLSTTTYVEAIGVSPGSGTNQTVLVSVLGKGLFRSTDAGNTFSEVATSLLAGNFLIGDFDNPTSAPIQFSPFYEQDQTIFAMAQQNILKSTNRGASWQVLTLPPASNIIQPPKIAAAPTAARVVEGANGTTRTVRVTFDLSHPYASAVTVQWQTARLGRAGIRLVGDRRLRGGVGHAHVLAGHDTAVRRRRGEGRQPRRGR